MSLILNDGRRLILASSSPYRQQLLKRLGLPFDSVAPDIDEKRNENETGAALALRLSLEKARQIVRHEDHALVIGSDQVAELDGAIVGKPGSHERARQQLLRASGRCVYFHTGLSLIDSRSGREQSCVEPFKVFFRRLCRAQIERYLEFEQPYQCAGSFKAEGFGITLFERLEGDDPNSLIGLPLIQLTRMLAAEAIHLP